MPHYSRCGSRAVGTACGACNAVTYCCTACQRHHRTTGHHKTDCAILQTAAQNIDNQTLEDIYSVFLRHDSAIVRTATRMDRGENKRKNSDDGAGPSVKRMRETDTAYEASRDREAAADVIISAHLLDPTGPGPHMDTFMPGGAHAHLNAEATKLYAHIAVTQWLVPLVAPFYADHRHDNPKWDLLDDEEDARLLARALHPQHNMDASAVGRAYATIRETVDVTPDAYMEEVQLQLDRGVPTADVLAVVDQTLQTREDTMSPHYDLITRLRARRAAPGAPPMGKVTRERIPPTIEFVEDMFEDQIETDDERFEAYVNYFRARWRAEDAVGPTPAPIDPRVLAVNKMIIRHYGATITQMDAARALITGQMVTGARKHLLSFQLEDLLGANRPPSLPTTFVDDEYDDPGRSLIQPGSIWEDITAIHVTQRTMVRRPPIRNFMLPSAQVLANVVSFVNDSKVNDCDEDIGPHLPLIPNVQLIHYPGKVTCSIHQANAHPLNKLIRVVGVSLDLSRPIPTLTHARSLHGDMRHTPNIVRVSYFVFGWVPISAMPASLQVVRHLSLTRTEGKRLVISDAVAKTLVGLSLYNCDDLESVVLPPMRSNIYRFAVVQCKSLNFTNFRGLENVRVVRYKYDVSWSKSVTALPHSPNLVAIGTLNLWVLPNLQTLRPLRNIAHVENVQFRLYDNTAMTSLRELERIVTLADELFVDFVPMKANTGAVGAILDKIATRGAGGSYTRP